MSSTNPSSSGWEPPVPEDLQRMLPQYEITGILGRGGMGAVYRGRQVNLDRDVAIKVLPETFSQGADELNFVARFRHEARAMAKLDHPAIISVYDFGETAAGQLYFVMEFIDGMDIHQYLKHHGGKLPQESALAITAHVLDALDYAHNHGIVHRDIKPANILLNQEGRVKIADFGLAKKFGEHADADAPALTMSNVAVGTPDFVAPEALDSDQTPDHRADLYGVGVMLYQMLTGKLPRGIFQYPSEINAEVDRRLDAIVEKAMAANPDYRYASAAVMRADLDVIFTQPFAKVEAGEDSAVVAAVVPVTSSVKGGKPAKLGKAGRDTPAVTERSKLPTYLGIGGAFAILAGLFLIATREKPIAEPPAVRSTEKLETRPATPKPPASADMTAGGKAKASASPAAAATVPEKLTPPPSTAFPQGQWVKLDEGNPATPGDWRWEDGWVEALSRLITIPGASGKNWGIRLRTRFVADPPANLQFIGLRNSRDGDAPERRYALTVSSNTGNFRLTLSEEGNMRPPSIHEYSKLDPTPGNEVVLELIAVGNRLFSKVNGIPQTIGTDTTLERGDVVIRNANRIRDIEVINLDGLPEAEALRLVGVDEQGRDLPAPQPETTAPGPPTTVTEAPQPRTSPDSEPPPSAQPNPDTVLAAIPDLTTLLEAYLSARRTQIGELAAKYERGLDARFNQAADAGDLVASKAFQEERTRLATLKQSLSEPVSDPRAAVSEADPSPDLPEGSPETLLTLRTTWDTERAKIHEDLEGKLLKSLQALETELTRARELEKAGAVMAYRESLGREREPSSPESTPAPSAVASTPAPGPGSVTPATGDLARATKDAPFENSLGMKFVPVPGTEVLFGIHEVRYRDYAAYAAEAQGVNGLWKDQSTEGFPPADRPEDHPVVRVSWMEAKAFCEWLGKKEGKTYRLPSDEEWSVAVGLGSKERRSRDTTPEMLSGKVSEYPWGGDFPPRARDEAGNYADITFKKLPSKKTPIIEGYLDGFATTAPVMSFKPNKFGLYDLGGNVWEHVEDWYDNSQKQHVLRGGSWENWSGGDLSSSRRMPRTNSHLDVDGFRCVLVPSILPPATAPPSANRLPSPDPALARATKDAPFENTLGMKFVPAPGTDVLFCIHETRYRDYAEYAKRAKESVDGTWKNQTFDGFEIKRDGDDHPVTLVNWDDAQKFCAWLSEKEGKTYRLPTDREWSLAVGIGREEEWADDTTPETVFKPDDAFPWGKEWPPPKGAGNFCDQSRKEKAPNDRVTYLDGYDDGFPTTAPVMRFKANKLGLFDMDGNVSEWVEDWASKEQKERGSRGGYWHHSGRTSLLSSRRSQYAPVTRYHFNGFRIVLETTARATAGAGG